MLAIQRRLYSAVVFATVVLVSGIALSGAPAQKPPIKVREDKMSPAGRAAAEAIRAIGALAVKDAAAADTCVNDAECEESDEDAISEPADDAAVVAPELQAELTVAVDHTGLQVVAGFNDFRGFTANALDPSKALSVSGFMYSSDGGSTFVDGGQLSSPSNDAIGTTKLPQVFGDPDVKYVGNCTFIYSSIIVKKFSATRAVQTLGLHRSLDCGHTWQGPFEVTPATNPHGAVSSTTGAPRDAADKEFMDVDPETGRVVMSWSNFTPFAPGGVEISTTYSDNILASPPTWSARQIVAAASQDGQGSVPRFAGGGSSNAYIAWARFPFPGVFQGYGNTIGFARSTNNGATWSAPVDVSSEFFTIDQVLGNDRVNTSPSLAVDTSNGPRSGAIYIVYSNNNLQDGADVVFQRSINQGLTFSAPIALNSRPGDDRAQWFPWVTVDNNTGRVHVFYYDQGIATSGDLSEVMHTYSEDGGMSWKQPLPLSERPFKAGWGNDTGQPNLGDYNQGVAQDAKFLAVWAGTRRPPLGFTDGQPSGSLTTPDVVVTPLEEATHKFRAPTVNLETPSFIETGGNGFLDPGETVSLQLPLRNYVTNPLNAARINNAQGFLSTTTPGVVVLVNHSPYPRLEPGATVSNKDPYVLQLLPSFVPGTPIELVLDVRTPEHGEMTLLHTLFTGTPLAATIFSENFNGASVGTLPAGWTAVHAGGANTVPWTTSNTFCGTSSNAAFHQNANDGPGPGGSGQLRFERLFSPLINVPSGAEYVTLEFDVCYDTEEDPNLNILAYDGFLLRVTDQTPGRTLRSVLVEAFEDEFTTGPLFHYPRHFPRSSNPNYFQDMSAWAGDSLGFRHVRMRLPGMAGSRVQLRFEFTQDGAVTCADLRPGHTCGVMFDNVVMKSVVSAPAVP